MGRPGADGAAGDGQFVRARRVIDVDAEHETVELGLRQRIGSLLFDGILRRHNDERRVETICFAVGRHGQFLHGLEEGGLRLGWCAVDFVRKDQVGEDGTAVKHQVASPAALVALQDLRAGDVGRHEVGRELNAAKLPAEQLGQRLHHHRLGQARDSDYHHVAARHQPGEEQSNHFALADQHLAHLGLEQPATIPQPLDSFFCRLDFAWIHSRGTPVHQRLLASIIVFYRRGLRLSIQESYKPAPNIAFDKPLGLCDRE